MPNYTGDARVSQSPLAWTQTPGLAEAVDREVERDRLFFRQHPPRDWRVRRAGVAEVASLAWRGPVPTGMRLLMAVIQFSPGQRGRFPFVVARSRAASSFTRAEAHAIAGQMQSRPHGVCVNMWGAA